MEWQRANPDDGAVREEVALTEGLVRETRQAVGATQRATGASAAAEGDEDGGGECSGSGDGGGGGGEGTGGGQPAVMKLRLKLSLVQAEAAYSEASYAIDAAAELLPLLRPPPESPTLVPRPLTPRLSRQGSSSTPEGRTKTLHQSTTAGRPSASGAAHLSTVRGTAEHSAAAPLTAANPQPAAATSNVAGGGDGGGGGGGGGATASGGVALSVLVEVACEDGISLRLLDDSTGARLASLTPAPP